MVTIFLHIMTHLKCYHEIIALATLIALRCLVAGRGGQRFVGDLFLYFIREPNEMDA